MAIDQKIETAQAAAGRLFRAYKLHCQNPDRDTLFALLNALHSLNDRLKKATKHDLHGIEEFIALKVLRNFAHHEDEVHSNVRIIPTPAQSDLLHMCIVRRDQIEIAIENVDKKWRDSSRKACEAHFHWYGDAVNINPALFNAVVRTYELLLNLDVAPPDDDVSSLRVSYKYETEQGYSHYVDGGLTANAAEISDVIAKVAADLPGI
jgi:hypothetical protein